MIKLLTVWAAWRLLRALAPILVIATLALLLLGSANQRASQSVGGRLQDRTRPLEQQLQHTLQEAFEP
jgi:hypothetical protein